MKRTTQRSSKGTKLYDRIDDQSRWMKWSGFASDALPDLDLEEDSPELEAELLKAVEGPHAPYSHEEMEAVLARVVAEERERRASRDR
jgi:hypothetical protein